MDIKPGHVQDFISIFQGVKGKIISQSGCISLQLFHDVKSPNFIFTVSRWSSQEALEDYRSSPFFQETWTKVKLYFDGPTKVWSLLEFEEIQ